MRADVFGVGPVFGACVVTTATAAKQCSQDGYVTSNAYAYRIRLDARFGEVLPGFDSSASAVLTHDVRRWSFDGALNEGRRTMVVPLRGAYRDRYLAEVSVMPIWGGDYNAQADRDQLAMSVGVKF